MNNIPEWYDRDEKRWRDDCWPFEKNAYADNRRAAILRRMQSIKTAAGALPEGWSLRWSKRRKHDFRVETGLKRIKAPFPKTHAGAAFVAAGVMLARHIEFAKAPARASRRPVGVFVKAFAFNDWQVGHYMNAGSIPYVYHWQAMHAMESLGVRRNVHFQAMRRGLHVSYAREVYRFLVTPMAWSVPRRLGRRPKQAPKLADPVRSGQDMIQMASHLCMLRAYLKQSNKWDNGLSHRTLPAKAPAKAKKILSTNTTAP